MSGEELDMDDESTALRSSSPTGKVSPTASAGKFPKAIPFIVGNEFCERFSYYGMRAILVLYFVRFLGWSDDSATVMYHAFIMASYTTSAFGGILADSKLGKYHTILYLSIVYCIGNAVTAGTSIPGATGTPPSAWGAGLGLFLIAVGTGGIKPCVAPFGGEQFSESQKSYLPTYFSMFYFSINLGSLFSMLVTPKLRGDVSCFGRDECYPLAFALPAVLMVVATVVFVMGGRYYKHRVPAMNVVYNVFRTLGFMIKESTASLCGRTGEIVKWQDRASREFGAQFVSDMRALKRVVIIFLPAPFFWALYDQQGSRWTLQAQKMSSFDMGALGRFRPDMMQALNALLILGMIPLFDRVIYPFLNKRKWGMSALQKMGLGMLLCCLAFIVSGVVQIKIEKSNELPEANSADSPVRFMNLCQDTAVFSFPGNNVTVPPLTTTSYLLSTTTRLNVTVSSSSLQSTVDTTLPVGAFSTLACVQHGLANVSIVQYTDMYDRNGEHPDKDLVRVFNVAYGVGPIAVHAHSDDGDMDFNVQLGTVSAFSELSFTSGSRSVTISNASSSSSISFSTSVSLQLDEDGALLTLAVFEIDNVVNTHLIPEVKGNQVSILWQIPQYVVVTAAEILFSITGLEFAFTQAPVSMKSVMHTVWLMTTAIGSLIVILVAESTLFPKQSDEFFAFAGLLFFVMLFFIFLARSYIYLETVSVTSKPDDQDEHDDTSPLLESTDA